MLLVSFPLSSLTASIVVGPALGMVPAALGGAIVGLGLGFSSALAYRQPYSRWVPATIVGLVVGTVASGLVPVVGPMLQGLAVGLAQAVVRPPLNRVLWVALTAAAWAAAWGISFVVAISDEPGFVTFGLSGALFYCLTMLVALVIAGRVTR